MQLNKHDLHTLKYLTFYKYLSVFGIIFGLLRIIGGIYDHFYRIQGKREIFLSNEIIGASLVVIGVSFLMLHFIKLIEKLKPGSITDN